MINSMDNKFRSVKPEMVSLLVDKSLGLENESAGNAFLTLFAGTMEKKGLSFDIELPNKVKRKALEVTFPEYCSRARAGLISDDISGLIYKTRRGPHKKQGEESTSIKTKEPTL